MKLPLLATLSGLTLAGIQLAHADADMEKAAKLFPEFSKAVYTDEKKARETYEILSNLSPAVQTTLLNWLDEQYEDKKSDYLSKKNSGGIRSKSISASDRREIKELREKLESIRKMQDEKEMKKEIEKSGWAALNKLLSLNNSTINHLEDARPSKPDPAAAKAVLEQVHQVGAFRQDLRKKLGKETYSIEEDLRESARKESKTEEAVSMEMNRKAASVLEKNEKLKGEIPSAEYKGILELNHWRIAAGMDPLLIDPKLCDASRDHCKDMESLGFFAHDSPVKGKTKPWDRAKNFGTIARGENIAINNSPSDSNKAWFFSPGHHKNMLNPEFSVIGLGIKGRHYCQLFR